VAMVQARFPSSVADHDAETLTASRDQIKRLLAGIHDPEAPVRPGPTQCQFCPAFGVCHEAKKTALVTVESQPLAVVPTGAELDAYAAIEKFIAERKRLARMALMQGLEIQGWTLGKGRRTVKVKDSTEAYSLLANVFEPREFAACCDVSITRLAEKYAEAKKLSQKTARTEVEALLSDVIEETVGAPSLKKGGE
jgi:hypothetical protein